MSSPNDSTHTVRYEQPSVLSALPLNKAAQCAFGVAIILVAFKLWSAGWFSMFAMHNGLQLCGSAADGQPMQSVGLVTILFDTLCLVGILGFAVCGFILRSLGPILGGLAEYWANATAWAKAKVTGEAVAGAKADTIAKSGASSSHFVARMPDGSALTQRQLNSELHKRIVTLELKTRDIALPSPPAPPKSDAERIAELEAKIAELSATVPKARKASAAKAVQS